MSTSPSPQVPAQGDAREAPPARARALGALTALCAIVFFTLAPAGCATRGVSTRALESRPVMQAYERHCSDAEDSRAAAQGGCPSCVY